MDENEKTSTLTYIKDKNCIPNTVEGVTEDALMQFRNAAKSTYSLNVTYDDGDYEEEGHFFLNGSGGILREFKSNQKGNGPRNMTPTRYMNVNFARQSNTILNDVGQIELNGEKDKVIDILKLLDPSIDDIITLAVQGITQLYIKSEGKLIPLQDAGDGVIMLLNICIVIMETPNGIVLIDELETGFHYSMYGKLLNVIDKISKQILLIIHTPCLNKPWTLTLRFAGAQKNDVIEFDD